MKKIGVLFILLFLCVSIRVRGIEFNKDEYLKEIKNNVITIGVQNKDESLQDFKSSHFAKYLKEQLNLKVELKKVSETEGANELLEQKIDFLENVSLKNNPKIKYLNYNLLNNIIIICRNNLEFNLNQLAYKKIGVLDKKDIRNYPIELLSRNNNIKLYKNFNEIAKALENKEIDLGICDRKNRFEVLLYDNLKFAINEPKWKWKEGVASANPKYYKLIDIINENIYNNPDLISKFFDSKDDFRKIIKKAFYKSLNNREREYISKKKFINVIAKDKSFPILYEQNNEYKGVLDCFFDSFSNLTNVNINYLVNNKKLDNDNDTIKENICYEKNEKVSNIIYKSSLSIACLNKHRLDFNSFDLVDKNKIGVSKELRLNKNNELLNNDIKYYENFTDSLSAIKNKEVSFILMNKELFDYYQLKENDKNIIRFKDLDIPTIYYLSANNDILSSILSKVYKVHYMETEVNKEKQWIVKDYMRKNYITELCKKKEFYKMLNIFCIGMLVVLIIFVVLSKRNMDRKKELNEKLDALLKKDSNIDIIEIDLKANKVKCNSGLIFNSKKRIDLEEYLNVMNLSIEDYLSEDKINMLNESKEVLVNGKYKYFKQYVYPSNNKKIISIITDVTKEVIEKIELQEKIKIDNLTGLTNRDYYEEEIENIINQNPKLKGAFVFIDINDFKQFNDKFGHDFGDKVIKVLANKLKSIENNNTLAFRIAGDEFGIYKHNIESEDEIICFLKKLCEKLTIEENCNEFVINISCSIGCTVDFENQNRIGNLRNHAEAQMYKAKKIKYIQSRYKLHYHKHNSKNK